MMITDTKNIQMTVYLTFECADGFNSACCVSPPQPNAKSKRCLD